MAVAVLVVASFVLVWWAGDGANGEFRSSAEACEQRDIPDSVDCWGAYTDKERALEAPIAGVRVLHLAVGLGVIGMALLATALPVRGWRGFGTSAGSLVAAAWLASMVRGAADYNSCDDPGYNDATASQVLTYDLATTLLVTMPLVVAVVALGRLAFTRRDVWVHLGMFVLSLGVAVIAAFWIVASSSC